MGRYKEVFSNSGQAIPFFFGLHKERDGKRGLARQIFYEQVNTLEQKERSNCHDRAKT
jgi:hypothetical protein